MLETPAWRMGWGSPQVRARWKPHLVSWGIFLTIILGMIIGIFIQLGNLFFTRIFLEWPRLLNTALFWNGPYFQSICNDLLCIPGRITAVDTWHVSQSGYPQMDPIPSTHGPVLRVGLIFDAGFCRLVDIPSFTRKTLQKLDWWNDGIRLGFVWHLATPKSVA